MQLFAHHGFHHLGLEVVEYLQAAQLVAVVSLANNNPLELRA